MPIWRALIAGLLVVGLGAALIYVFVSDTDESPSPPTLATASTSSETSTPPATVTIPTPTTSTTSTPSPTAAPPIVTSTVAPTPLVVTAMHDALTAWGQFATTGLMRDLGDHFVVGGPQRRLLRAEAPAIRENPPGPPSYVVATRNISTVSVTTDDVVLRAEIEWSREGEPTRFFTWDIQMRRVNDAWRLLTVEDVTPGG